MPERRRSCCSRAIQSILDTPDIYVRVITRQPATLSTLKAKTQVKHRHHIIPELFLKGFACPFSNIYQKTPDIWVYKKGFAWINGQNPSLESVKNVACVEDYFAFQQTNGETEYEKYENLLMRNFEQPADKVIQRIRSKEDINDDEIRIFSRYVASMITRSSWWRRHTDSVFTKVELAVRNHWTDKTKDENIKKYLEELVTHRAEAMRSSEFMRADDIERAEEISQILQRMIWRFATTPKKMYLPTSDHPISYWNLDKPYAELIFPVSSEIVLVLSYKKDVPAGSWKARSRMYWEISERDVEKVRDFVCRGAYQEVYSCQNAKWLTTFINNRPYVEKDFELEDPISFPSIRFFKS